MLEILNIYSVTILGAVSARYRRWLFYDALWQYVNRRTNEYPRTDLDRFTQGIEYFDRFVNKYLIYLDIISKA